MHERVVKASFRALAVGTLMAGSVMAAPLRAGYAKVDITPAEPVMLAGYDLRSAPSDGVHGHDKLFARCLAFDDGSRKVLFVEGDVIIIRNTDAFRKSISEATGVPVANVLLGDVHNHAAPSPSAAGENKWEKEFAAAVVAAARSAIENLQPARIASGTGRSRIAMNRRQVQAQDRDSPITFDENARSQSFGSYRTDNPVPIHEFAGVMRLGANPSGRIDDAVQVVRIDTGQGRPLAVMVDYACHGTSLGGRNSKVSGEWMGRMQEYIEQQIPGVGSIYLQGAAGDINPRAVGGLDGYADNIETTWALGEEIGREVVRVYGALAPEPVSAPIELATADIRMPRAYRELFDDFKNTAVIAPTTVVRIGGMMWVTFPGEMFHAIGERVKASCPVANCYLMGYTNGYIGYFPEQRAFAEGGYEPAVSHLDPTAEPVYMRQIADVLKRFRLSPRLLSYAAAASTRISSRSCLVPNRRGLLRERTPAVPSARSSTPPASRRSSEAHRRNDSCSCTPGSPNSGVLPAAKAKSRLRFIVTSIGIGNDVNLPVATPNQTPLKHWVLAGSAAAPNDGTSDQQGQASGYDQRRGPDHVQVDPGFRSSPSPNRSRTIHAASAVAAR